MLLERKILIKEILVFFDLLIISFLCFFAYTLRNNLSVIRLFTIFPLIGESSYTLNVLDNQFFIACFTTLPIFYITLNFNGLYTPLRSIKFSKLLKQNLKMTLMSMFFFGSILLLLHIDNLSRIFLIGFILLTSFCLSLERMILYLLFQLTQNVNYNAVNLLIVGKGKRVAQFIDKIKNKPELGYSIYGIIDDEEYPEKKNGHLYKKINNIPIIGYLYNLDKILSNNPIDEVIFIVPRSRLHYMENVIHHICATYGIKVNIAVDLFDITIANAKLSEVDNLHMLTFDSNPAREWQLMVKRLVDITVSLIILSILIIPLLVVAAMIKLTSPGPVLFVQKRVGVNGKLFSLYKFRSMYKDADKKLKQVLDKNIMTGPVFKMKNDPRVTPVGRIIRKYSIDEFPQFFNVLAGHMSLVGPRPNLITEVKQYQPWQMRRLSMRPGITCLWQINGRSNTSFEYWMKKDLMYLDEWSLGLDFKILYKTVPVVLKATGAY